MKTAAVTDYPVRVFLTLEKTALQSTRAAFVQQILWYSWHNYFVLTEIPRRARITVHFNTL